VLSFSLNRASIGIRTPTLEKAVRDSMTLFETVQNIETDSPVATCIDEERSQILSASRPEIHFTVPGFKVGWRDENGNWFDEDGPRKGPPLNYWRQMSDEVEHKRDMDALNNALAELDIEETVRTLEKRRSIRFPSLHRKLLGKWVPILVSGKCITSNDAPVDEDTSIEVPYTMEIFRTNGRKYAPKSPYGIFDLKLSRGEQLTAKVTNQKDTIISHNFLADNSNEPMILGAVDEDRPIYLGKITYMTDYIMIQRNQDGKVDFWLRADDSYFGVKDSSVAIGETKIE